jgi:hypothetical protein
MFNVFIPEILHPISIETNPDFDVIYSIKDYLEEEMRPRMRFDSKNLNYHQKNDLYSKEKPRISKQSDNFGVISNQKITGIRRR